MWLLNWLKWQAETLQMENYGLKYQQIVNNDITLSQSVSIN